MSFGANLQTLRQSAGYKQEDLAELLGVTRRTIVKYEAGSSLPSFEQLPKLAKIFGITIDELMTAEDEFLIQAFELKGLQGIKEASVYINGVIGLFAGGHLSPEDKNAAMKAISDAFFIADDESKKYTPKKFRLEKAGEDDG